MYTRKGSTRVLFEACLTLINSLAIRAYCQEIYYKKQRGKKKRKKQQQHRTPEYQKMSYKIEIRYKHTVRLYARDIYI